MGNAQNKTKIFSSDTVSLEGEVILGIAENFENNSSTFFVDLREAKSKRIYSLSFKDGKVPSGLKTGKKIKIKGRKNIKNEDDLVVEALEVSSGTEDSSIDSGSAAGQLDSIDLRKIMVVSVNIRTINSAISPSSAIQSLYKHNKCKHKHPKNELWTSWP